MRGKIKRETPKSTYKDRRVLRPPVVTRPATRVDVFINSTRSFLHRVTKQLLRTLFATALSSAAEAVIKSADTETSQILNRNSGMHNLNQDRNQQNMYGYNDGYGHPNNPHGSYNTHNSYNPHNSDYNHSQHNYGNNDPFSAF